MDAKIIGERVRAARQALGLSQTEVGAGRLTRSFISQVERGRVVPSLRALEIIATTLHRPLGYFLDLGESADSAEIEYRLAVGYLWLQESPEAALALFAEAVALCRQAGSQDLLVSSLYHLAMALLAANRPDEALREAHEVIRLALERRDEHQAGLGRRLLARIKHALGQDEDALEDIRSLITGLAGRPIPDPFLLGELLLEQAEYLAALGRNSEATAVLDQAEKIWQGSNSPSGIVATHRGLAERRREGGDLLGAVREAHRGKRAAFTFEHLRRQGWLRFLKGQLAAEASSDPSEHLQAAIAHFHQGGDILGEGRALLALADADLARGRAGTARRKAEEALDLFREAGAQAWEAQAVWFFGRMERREGKNEEAVKTLKRAAAILEPLRQPRDLAAIYSELGSLLTSLGQLTEANEYLARSVELLQGLQPARPRPRFEKR